MKKSKQIITEQVNLLPVDVYSMKLSFDEKMELLDRVVILAKKLKNNLEEFKNAEVHYVTGSLLIISSDNTVEIIEVRDKAKEFYKKVNSLVSEYTRDNLYY